MGTRDKIKYGLKVVLFYHKYLIFNPYKNPILICLGLLVYVFQVTNDLNNHYVLLTILLLCNYNLIVGLISNDKNVLIGEMFQLAPINRKSSAILYLIANLLYSLLISLLLSFMLVNEGQKYENINELKIDYQLNDYGDSVKVVSGYKRIHAYPYMGQWVAVRFVEKKSIIFDRLFNINNWRIALMFVVCLMAVNGCLDEILSGIRNSFVISVNNVVFAVAILVLLLDKFGPNEYILLLNNNLKLILFGGGLVIILEYMMMIIKIKWLVMSR